MCGFLFSFFKFIFLLCILAAIATSSSSYCNRWKDRKSFTFQFCWFLFCFFFLFNQFPSRISYALNQHNFLFCFTFLQSVAFFCFPPPSSGFSFVHVFFTSSSCIHYYDDCQARLIFAAIMMLPVLAFCCSLQCKLLLRTGTSSGFTNCSTSRPASCANCCSGNEKRIIFIILLICRNESFKALPPWNSHFRNTIDLSFQGCRPTNNNTWNRF